MNRGSSFGNRRAVGGVPRSPTAESSHAKTDQCQRRRHRRVVPRTPPRRGTRWRRRGSSGMAATFATDPSFGRADTARPSVLRRRCSAQQLAVDARSAPEAVFRPHASNEVPDGGLDAWPAWPPSRASAPPSRHPAALPPGDGRRLDQPQRLPPPRPHPSQAHPEQAVKGAEAAIGPREDAELVAKSEDLEEEVPTRAQGGAKHRNRPQRVSHGPQNGRQQRPRQRFSARTR